MNPAVLSLGALLLVIAASFTSRVNVGVLAVALAWPVAMYGAGWKADALAGAFPSSLFLTLLGVTLLFGIAQANGTMAAVTHAGVRACKGRAGWLPLFFFALACGIATMGPGAIAATALVAPLALGIAHRAKVPMLLAALMVGNGANAGNLSPISAVGVIVETLMTKAGVGGHGWVVWAANFVAHALAATGAWFLFGGPALLRSGVVDDMADDTRLETRHRITLAVGLLWIASVLILKVNPGFAAFGAAALLVIGGQAEDSALVKQVPWAVIVMVCGVSVLVGVLEKTGGMDLFTTMLAKISTPRTVNGTIAFVTGLISTYSSTSGVVYPAFLPAVPGLVAKLGGGNPLEVALSINVGAAIVDVSPLSTIGALCIAAIPAGHDPKRLFRQLLVWGFSMTLAGALFCQLAIGLFASAEPVGAVAASASESQRLTAAIAARGDSLMLPGRYVPPPGSPIEHHTAGFAKTLCSAVFVTGLDPSDAAANVGFFTGPLEHRGEVIDTVVDRATRTVRLTLKSGVTRVAHRYGSQGCIVPPVGHDSVFFTPSVVTSKLPPAATTPWPMGDVLAPAPWPAGVDSARVAQAVDAAFGGPDAMTLGFLVLHNGRIIGERYAKGITPHTPLESWSMGKSLTGTLMARLIQQGAYTLDLPAPIPEWQTPGDPRQQIRIMDIMRMSSGLRLRNASDPDYKDDGTYPDHLYLYTGGINSYRYAATRVQQWKPNTVGRYRNTDPVLTNYLTRLAVEKRGEDYHAFPTRALFDRIGIRDAVMDTDPYGNFLTQGYELLPARDWARLALLYMQDGAWNGERLLPKGYVDYVSTVAPAWAADRNPVYGGGFFWVNGDGGQPLPKSAFAMLGAGGQSVWLVPSHGLVIVRIGKYRGEQPGDAALRKGMTILMQAVRPVTKSP